ncbi:hypothetical protein [Morganella morganii]|uniref:hypothetical protein n=1 Tax=Morganella morganii TaxID=582 RepID=UPI00236746EF|nr:hypothetical protein [Morganella morganii]
MTTSVTTTGSVELFHFNKIEKKNNQDDIVTLSSNGRESCLTAGRSLSERVIIALNGSILGSLPFVKRAYENLEHRDAEALHIFCDAVVNAYGENTRDIVDEYFNGRKQLKVSDINIVIDKAIENQTNYKVHNKKNEDLESLLKEKGYPDFNMSQLNNCDFHLLNNIHDIFNNLIKGISKGRSFSDKFISALETRFIDCVTSIPRPSHKFADIVSGKNSSGSNTDGQQYEIDKIKIDDIADDNFTAEDFKQIIKEAVLLKARLLHSGQQDKYRYQVYADIFRKVNRMPPQVHINATASENIVPPQLPSLPQVHTDATPPPPPPPPPPNIDTAASENKQFPPINPTALPSERVELRKKTENNKQPEIDLKTAMEAAIDKHRKAKGYSINDEDVNVNANVNRVNNDEFHDCN